jgi:hypothetical protein
LSRVLKPQEQVSQAICGGLRSVHKSQCIRVQALIVSTATNQRRMHARHPSSNPSQPPAIPQDKKCLVDCPRISGGKNLLMAILSLLQRPDIVPPSPPLAFLCAPQRPLTSPTHHGATEPALPAACRSASAGQLLHSCPGASGLTPRCSTGDVGVPLQDNITLGLVHAASTRDAGSSRGQGMGEQCPILCSLHVLCHGSPAAASHPCSVTAMFLQHITAAFSTAVLNL